MPIQRRNDELVNMLGGNLQQRYESSFAWRTACSMFQALPGLRGFWPMSAGGANAYDQSGNARTLTYAGNPVYGSGVAFSGGLTPWINFDGAGDYLTRADEGGLDILGTEAYIDVPGLTLGGWFYPTDITTTRYLMSKWNPAANRSYALIAAGAVANDPMIFQISDDGTNSDSVSSTSGYSADTWQFMAGRYNDALTGAELAVWLNDEQDTAATARNSIFNSSAPFNISGYNNGNSLFAGYASMCFLCTAALHDSVVWAIYQHTRALFGV